MPHVNLVHKLWKRNRELEFNIGDRIPYVILYGRKKDLVSNLSENPVYAFEHDLPLNYDYYLEKQIKKPLERIFGAFMDSKNLFDELISKKSTRQKIGTN